MFMSLTQGVCAPPCTAVGGMPSCHSFVDTGCQEARKDYDFWEHSREKLHKALLTIARIPPQRVLLGVWSGADCSLALREIAPQDPCETPAPASCGSPKLPARRDAMSTRGGPAGFPRLAAAGGADVPPGHPSSSTHW